MIVWLASYPRSGNTLTRLILARAFGRLSASVYPEGEGDAETSWLGLRIKLAHDGSHEDLLAAARRSAEPVFIKTHGPPPDDSAAIYILRDGRAAVVSYCDFLRNMEGRDVSLAQVVRGEVGFGSWSGHLDAWSPLDRPRTLALRFETMRERPDEAVAAIAGFIGRPAVADWTNPWTELHRLVPGFFRHGADGPNIAALAGDDLALFWARHGAWMTRLGYGAGLAPHVVQPWGPPSADPQGR